MKNIIYDNNLSVEDYIMLRNTTTWASLSETQVANCIKNSSYIVRATCEGKTVGMARVLFDFGYSAYIADVIVHPDFQRCSIGTHMVKQIVDWVKNNSNATDYVQFNLMAAKGKEPFYEKMGFVARPNDCDGHGMCLRFND